MRRIIVFVGAALFLGAVTTEAATIYSQSNILRDDTGVLDCNGGSVGKCTISEQAAVGTSGTANDDIKVKCSLKGAQPNTSFEVFWTCTNTARGCHNQACGFISLGFVSTNGVGKGTFSDTLGNNPFIGKFVHLDMLGGGRTYTAVYAGIPIGTGPVGPAGEGGSGDPSGR